MGAKKPRKPVKNKASSETKLSAWERQHAAAWLREPGLAEEYLPSPAWTAPLEGRSAADVLTQHADPLRALHEGRVPAVVLRSHMDPADAAGIVRQLQRDLSLQKKKVGGNLNSGNGDATDRWKRRGETLHMLGADLHYSLKREKKFPTGAHHARYAQHYAAIVEELGVMAAVRALHGGLRSIAAGRRVATAVDPSTNLTFSQGLFRMHHPGNVFPIHIDSLCVRCRGSLLCTGSPNLLALLFLPRRLHCGCHHLRDACTPLTSIHSGACQITRSIARKRSSRRILLAQLERQLERTRMRHRRLGW